MTQPPRNFPRLNSWFIAPTCLGSDQRITNTGGGNTSAKLTETDPLTGKPVEVLWVKGSGGDLRTANARTFPRSTRTSCSACRTSTRRAPTRASRSPAEDDMVDAYHPLHLQPEPARALHRHAAARLLPGRHVDHMHPNAVIAIAASKNAARS